MTKRGAKKYQSSYNKLNQLIDHPIVNRWITGFSFLILVAAAVFAGLNATTFQLNNGDQYVSAAIFGDLHDGSPMIAEGHTNILKLPVLWLQGNLSQDFSLYAVTNIIFIFISIILWSLLIARLLGWKLLPIMLLGFSAVLVASPTLAIDLSMVTIRHIEYPLALLILVGIQKVFLMPRGRARTLQWLIGLGSLLGLIILNDKFFLYTLVPTILIGGLIFAYKRRHYREFGVVVAIAAMGILTSVVVSKLLIASGLISISSGYAEATSIIELDRIIDASIMTFGNVLNLFGGLIFGQEVRKANLSLFIGFALFASVCLGVFYAIRNERAGKNQLIHLFLLLFSLFILAAYIAPDFVNTSSTRYLTGLVYVGMVYLAYLTVLLSKRVPAAYLIVCASLLTMGLISLPRVSDFYQSNFALVERDNQRTILTARILEENNTSVVVTSGGHYSLWFYAKGNITLTQLENKCDAPSQWANNSSWLKPSDGNNSAFLVDQSYAEQAGRSCDIATVQKLYGPAEKIIAVPKPNEKEKEITTYLLLYDYDIRSQF